MPDVLTPEEAARLEAAYERYRSAMRAMRGNNLSEAAADLVVRARVELCRTLVSTGWDPPAAIRVQLERDEALMASPAMTPALLALIA